MFEYILDTFKLICDNLLVANICLESAMRTNQSVAALLSLILILALAIASLIRWLAVPALVAYIIAIGVKSFYPSFVMTTGTIWFSLLVTIQIGRSWRTNKIRELREYPRLLLFGNPVSGTQEEGCLARGHLALHRTLFDALLSHNIEIVVVRYNNSEPPKYWQQYFWLIRHNLIPLVPSDVHVVIVTDQTGQATLDERTSFYGSGEVDSRCFAEYCRRLKAQQTPDSGPQ